MCMSVHKPGVCTQVCMCACVYARALVSVVDSEIAFLSFVKFVCCHVCSCLKKFYERLSYSYAAFIPF